MSDEQTVIIVRSRTGLVDRVDIDRFYEQIEPDEHPADWPFVFFPFADLGRVDELILDGHFSLDHLKKIVAAWEELVEKKVA